MLHGGAKAWIAAIGVAESCSVDVERGILGGKGRCGQRVGRVGEGRWLPQTAAATGRLVQRDLLILAPETGNEGACFQNTTQKILTFSTHFALHAQDTELLRDRLQGASSLQHCVIHSRRQQPGCSQPWQR